MATKGQAVNWEAETSPDSPPLTICPQGPEPQALTLLGWCGWEMGQLVPLSVQWDRPYPDGQEQGQASGQLRHLNENLSQSMSLLSSKS